MQHPIKKKCIYLTHAPFYSYNQFNLGGSTRSPFDYSRLAIPSFFRCSRQVNHAISRHMYFVSRNNRRVNNSIAA